MTLLNILGSFLVGFGIMGLIWFLRNLFRPRYNKAMAYQKFNKGIIILLILAFFVGGFLLCATGGKLLSIGVGLGIIAGLIISRK